MTKKLQLSKAWFLISNFQPSENEISNKLFEKYKTNLNKLNKMQSQMIIKNMMTTDNVKP